ncbi:MAG: hypothetical protein ISP74_09060, partial [Bacteroidia bacterium]|nr:hypothetical protein [Bacteroidia bacterium]
MIHANLNNQPASRPQWYVKLRQVQFAIKLEESIQKIEKQPQFLNEIAKKARAYIESHHNEATEKQDIKN